jgi:hypothetical protein
VGEGLLVGVGQCSLLTDVGDRAIEPMILGHPFYCQEGTRLHTLPLGGAKSRAPAAQDKPIICNLWHASMP